jgi:selenophosphate synthase
MINPNISEIGKIVREMTKDVTSAPNYNAAAADIVKQGIVDKNNARLGYQTVLTKPLGRVTPPKTL